MPMGSWALNQDLCEGLLMQCGEIMTQHTSGTAGADALGAYKRTLLAAFSTLCGPGMTGVTVWTMATWADTVHQ
jgi:hypothetical protein